MVVVLRSLALLAGPLCGGCVVNDQMYRSWFHQITTVGTGLGGEVVTGMTNELNLNVQVHTVNIFQQ